MRVLAVMTSMETDFQNVVLVGCAGTGKTHLATPLAVQAIQHDQMLGRFLSSIEVVNALGQEKHYCFICLASSMNVLAL